MAGKRKVTDISELHAIFKELKITSYSKLGTEAVNVIHQCMKTTLSGSNKGYSYERIFKAMQTHDIITVDIMQAFLNITEIDKMEALTKIENARKFERCVRRIALELIDLHHQGVLLSKKAPKKNIITPEQKDELINKLQSSEITFEEFQAFIKSIK